MPLIGIDIEQISRVERILARTPRFAERIFTPAERAYCSACGRPAQHYAARFCAKEAFAKALGRPFSWQDVEILRGEDGPPSVRLSGEAAEEVAGRTVRVSMSHAGDYATAVILIED